MQPASAEKALVEGLALFKQELITEKDYNDLKQIVLNRLAERIEKDLETECEDTDSGDAFKKVKVEFSTKKRGPGRPKNSLNKSTIQKMNATDAVEETSPHISVSIESVTIGGPISYSTDALTPVHVSRSTNAVEIESTVDPNYFASAVEGIDLLDRNHFLMQSPDMSIFQQEEKGLYGL